MLDNWNELVAVFDNDDGSLPDIELNNLSRDQVLDGYVYIRDHSNRLVTEGPSYWSKSRDSDVLFSHSENPAEAALSGDTDSFHIVFGGIKSPKGKVVPDLGLFVHRDCLSFDYRKGPEWNEEALEGLFELILGISMELKESDICHTSNIDDYDGSIFKDHFSRYLSLVI